MGSDSQRSALSKAPDRGSVRVARVSRAGSRVPRKQAFAMAQPSEEFEDSEIASGLSGLAVAHARNTALWPVRLAGL
jgi:hypothetical protein